MPKKIKEKIFSDKSRIVLQSFCELLSVIYFEEEKIIYSKTFLLTTDKKLNKEQKSQALKTFKDWKIKKYNKTLDFF